MTELDLTQRDPAYLAKALPLLRGMTKYFRSEVRDIDRIPTDTGALLVSNHSGGALAVDLPLIAVAFFDEFGTERGLFCLAHDSLFMGPMGPVMRKAGLVPATRENAAAVLEAGAVTVVFPGGDHDTLRPSRLANVIDFAGRKGYVRTALAAGVPIVPVVSIGGQETQLFISRGERLNRLLQVNRFMRSKYFPISFGFPWGLTGAFPMNVPLPSKIVTQVLEPIDLARYGAEATDAVVDEIDELVRGRHAGGARPSWPGSGGSPSSASGRRHY